MDREKIVRGIDICLNRFHCGDDCPYYDNSGCQEQLREDALSLLKEQEPKQVEAEVINEIDRFYRCPSCHISMILRKQPYCHSCGQAVKWE